MNTNTQKISGCISSQSTYHHISKRVTICCDVAIFHPDFNYLQFKYLQQFSIFSPKSLAISDNSFVHDSSQEAIGHNIKNPLHISDVNDSKLTLNEKSSRASAQLAKYSSRTYQNIGKTITPMPLHNITRQQKLVA